VIRLSLLATRKGASMGTNGPLVDQDTSQQPRSIDLNRAGKDDLSALPGIGPVLAGRIIAYREAHGPFLDVAELTRVSGIGPAVLKRVSGDLTVFTPTANDDIGPVRSAPLDKVIEPAPEEAAPPPLPVEQVIPEEVTDVVADELIQEATELPIEESLVESEPLLEADLPMGELETVPELEPAPEEAFGLEDGREPALPVATPEPQRNRWTWVWSSLLGAVLGGILGLVLALLVFAGINGALDVRRSTAFKALDSKVSGLGVEIDAVRSDVGALQGDVDGLRARVEVLSGLTARMDQAESTIDTFGREIETLQSSMDEVTQHVDDLGREVDALKLQSAQTMSFFEQLRALLDGIFGSKEPQGALPGSEEVN